jgi:hypothetical protein
MRQKWFGMALIPGLCLSGCASDSGSGDEEQERRGGQAAVTIAPLDLEGATNACWRLTITNGRERNGEIVWQDSQVCADDFGDGRGGVAYVGTCDATSETNSVTIELLDIYTDPEGNAVKLDPSEYLNPCGQIEGWGSVGTRVLKEGEDAFPLCTRNITCRENEDTAVAFDVTVVRDANQGFFDIAVRFDDIFCSAKLDTCNVDEQGVESPIELLFGEDGVPVPTAVLALACSAGPGDDVNTILHMSSIAVDCPPPFDDIYLDPSAGDGGNVWNFEGSPSDPKPEDAVVQYAVYEQTELLECGEKESCNKRFWNVAIGFDPSRLPSGCYIRATATTTDGGFPDESGDPTGRFPDGAGYALISYAAQITKSGGELACIREGLNDGGGVSVVFPDPNASCAPDFCYYEDATGTWNDRLAGKILDKVLGGTSEWCEDGRVPVRSLVSADTLCAGSVGQCCLEVWKEAATKRGLLDSNGCATSDAGQWAIGNVPQVPSLTWCNAPIGYDFPVSFGPSDIDFEPTDACAPLELSAASLQSAINNGGTSYCDVGDLEACLPRDERLVLAGVETYLKYAEAMGLTQEGASVSDNVQGYFSVETGLKLLEALGGTASGYWNGSNWVADVSGAINPNRLVGIASVETYLKFAEALGMTDSQHTIAPVVQVMASVETYLKYAEAMTHIPSVVYRAVVASVETYLKYAEAVEPGDGSQFIDAGFSGVETHLKYGEALTDNRRQELIASIETYLKFAEAGGNTTLGPDFPIASVETWAKYAEATRTTESAMRLGLVSSLETWAKYAEFIGQSQGQSPCVDPGSRWFQAFSNFDRFNILAELTGLDAQTYLELTFDFGASGDRWSKLADTLGAPGLTLRNNYDANLRPNYVEDPDAEAPGAADAGLVGLSSAGSLLSWGNYSSTLQRRVLEKGLVQCRDEGALIDLVNSFGDDSVDRILDKGVVSGVGVRRMIEGYAPWGDPNPPASTEVSGESDGVSLPLTTLHVASTQGFSPSGVLRLQVMREGSLQWERYRYEVLTSTSFSLQPIAYSWYYWQYGWGSVEEGYTVEEAVYTPAEFIDRSLDKGLVASDSLRFEDVLQLVAGVSDNPERIFHIYEQLVDKGYVSYNASPFEVLDLVGLIMEQGEQAPSKAAVLDRVLDKGVVVRAVPIRSVFELARSLHASSYSLAEALDRLSDKGLVTDMGLDSEIGPMPILERLGDLGIRNPIATTVSAESDGQELPTQVLHVVSTEGFPPSGYLRVQIRGEGRILNTWLEYEAKTPTSFALAEGWGWGTLEEGFKVVDVSVATPAEVVDRILDKGMVTHGELSLDAIRVYAQRIIGPSDRWSLAEVMDRLLDKGAFVLQGDENFSNLTAFGVGANSGLETNDRILDKGIVIDGLNSRASDFELFRELQHIFAGLSPEEVDRLLDKGIVIERVDGCIRIFSVEEYLKYAEAVGGTFPVPF